MCHWIKWSIAASNNFKYWLFQHCSVSITLVHFKYLVGRHLYLLNWKYTNMAIVRNKSPKKCQYKQIPANPIRLIFEILLCVLLIIPAVLWATIKLFHKSPRKNISGQVVLVSNKKFNLYDTFLFLNVCLCTYIHNLL